MDTGTKWFLVLYGSIIVVVLLPWLLWFIWQACIVIYEMICEWHPIEKLGSALDWLYLSDSYSPRAQLKIKHKVWSEGHRPEFFRELDK